MTRRGPEGTLGAMATYTPLSPADLAAACAAFGLPPPDRVAAEPKGRVNTSLHLWAGGERWFLRVAEAATPAEVAFEAEVQVEGDSATARVVVVLSRGGAGKGLADLLPAEASAVRFDCRLARRPEGWQVVEAGWVEIPLAEALAGEAPPR